MQTGIVPKRRALRKAPNELKARNLNTGTQFPRRPLLEGFWQKAKHYSKTAKSTESVTGKKQKALLNGPTKLFLEPFGAFPNSL